MEMFRSALRGAELPFVAFHLSGAGGVGKDDVDARVRTPRVSIANYDVNPDGKRFVMVKDEAGSGRLAVVLNWTEELKRLVDTLTQ
jgi:hypothetical protein